MDYKLKSILLLICLLLLSINKCIGQIQYVGIPSANFNYVYSEQLNSEWCWAASIQMILNYYGVNINQKEIVERSYGTYPNGNLPNWPASFQTITANLNNWSIDDNGTIYTVVSEIGWRAPTPAILLKEIGNQAPVLLSYMSSPSSGHAVVATGVGFTRSYYGPVLQTIIVRDPWPSRENIANDGRVEYPATYLASRITAYWYIRVQKAD